MMEANKDLAVSASGSGARLVVTAVGILDVSTVDRLEAAVNDELRPGVTVLLDLADLTTCDSTGLGALVRLHRRAERLGGKVALRSPRPHIADLLAMSGISKVLEVLPARSG
jgi:anti-sigma B factor antagonist